MGDQGELAAWARGHLPVGAVLPQGPLAVTPITGDAGFRHYFRINSDPSLIAVIAPPDRENNPAFVAKARVLRAAGVHVPTVHAVDYDRGYMVLEDLGDRLYLPLLNTDTADSLYDAAEETLVAIQGAAPDPDVFASYDQSLLQQEMALFPEWFVGRLLGVELNAGERRLLEDTFATLVSAALAQPQVVVHRDYHSRNLLWMPGGRVGVVDFQDAVVGAFSYDLVSLLKDCYIRWPAAMVRQRALGFLRGAWRRLRGGDAGVDDRQLLAWFHLMGLQRHLKVLGIFARLWLRDGKARYLDDLPLVLRYTLEVTGEYKEFSSFHQWFGDRLMPAIIAQPWYRPWRQAGDTP